MDPGDPDEPSREELESRVAELEQTVSKMLPDRRGVLKGLGAAAIGGAAVGGATGGASGQSAAGQVGTESEPVDVEAANVAAQSVSTDDATTVTLNVPSDYATLPDAVVEANKIYKRRGFEVVVNIESGYSPANGLEFERGFYGHITIQSEDATVSVDSGWNSSDPFIVGTSAWLPKLDCLIDMQGLNPDTDASYLATRNCMAEVGSGGGVINSGNHGFLGRNGQYWLDGTNWYGAAADGIEAQQLSTVQAVGADVSNCGRYGIFTSREATFHGESSGDASNCGTAGLRAARSYANVQGWNLSGGPRAMQIERAAIVNGSGVNASGTTGRGINIFNGYVNAQGADLSGSDGSRAVVAEGSAVLRLGNADFSNPGTASAQVFVAGGSNVNLVGSTFDTYGNAAVEIAKGALAQVHNVTVGGAAITANETNQSSLNSITSDGIIFG